MNHPRGIGESRVFDISSKEAVKRIKEFVREHTLRLPLSEKRRFQILLAVEEVVVNIMNHGRVKSPCITVEVSANTKGLTVSTLDDGVPFNPLEVEEQRLNTTPDRSRIGGLGILLIKELTDGLNYERVGEKNRIELFFNLEREV